VTERSEQSERSLAHERTLLAWNRTAIGWLAAGLVGVRYFGPDGLLTAEAGASYALVLAGLVLFAIAQRRGSTPAGSRLLRGVSIVTTLAVTVVLVTRLTSPVG
jgi:uncharacterized membrane protein YidH (DUF202 family)